MLEAENGRGSRENGDGKEGCGERQKNAGLVDTVDNLTFSHTRKRCRGARSGVEVHPKNPQPPRVMIRACSPMHRGL